MDRAWNGEKENTRLADDEQCDGVRNLEEMSTNGICQSASQGVVYKIPHLKYFYTNTHSMRNKQDELKTLAWSQRFDVTDMSEIWADESSDWSALLDDYRPFRRDRAEEAEG